MQNGSLSSPTDGNTPAPSPMQYAGAAPLRGTLSGPDTAGTINNTVYKSGCGCSKPKTMPANNPMQGQYNNAATSYPASNQQRPAPPVITASQSAAMRSTPMPNAAANQLYSNAANLPPAYPAANLVNRKNN